MIFDMMRRSLDIRPLTTELVGPVDNINRIYPSNKNHRRKKIKIKIKKNKKVKPFYSAARVVVVTATVVVVATSTTGAPTLISLKVVPLTSMIDPLRA